MTEPYPSIVFPALHSGIYWKCTMCRRLQLTISELRRYLVGRDPFRIEHHWRATYRGAFRCGEPILNAAISGADIALWDILGEAVNRPAWQLMGVRCRDRRQGARPKNVYGKPILGTMT